MIILAFQGAGKTTYAKTHDNAVDLDTKDFDTRVADWEKAYVDNLVDADVLNDYVFGNISKEVMAELDNRGINFKVFAPIRETVATKEDEDLKALLLGRYVVRKEQTPQNLKWLNRIKKHYDEWTDKSFFNYRYAIPVKMTMSLNTIEDLLGV